MKQPFDFGFNEEAKLLKQTARQLLQKKLPTLQLHKIVADESDPFRTPRAKWDASLWKEMVELGWSSLAVPESAGGMNMPLVAVTGLVEEAGRAALPSPLLSTLQATCLLRACETKAANGALELIQSGRNFSVVLCNAQGAFDSVASGVVATQDGNRIVLNGTGHFVQDAAKADHFIVACRGDSGIAQGTAHRAPTDNALYMVASNAKGVKIIPDHIVDLTRDQAHVEFDNVVLSVGAIHELPLLTTKGIEVLNKAMPALLTLLAADMAGAAEWQLQTTVEYARTRVQFDHPIGFFQAVKHPLVDLMMLVDQTRGLLYNAACAIDCNAADAELFARMAKASACDMAAFASKKSVQLHGGIGFTWECFIHLYQKRQKHSQILWGDAMYQRQKIATLVFDLNSSSHQY
jgi:alkylation response protein AidB-like acyl-CoA dehydrogenase